MIFRFHLAYTFIAQQNILEKWRIHTTYRQYDKDKCKYKWNERKKRREKNSAYTYNSNDSDNCNCNLGLIRCVHHTKSFSQLLLCPGVLLEWVRTTNDSQLQTYRHNRCGCFYCSCCCWFFSNGLDRELWKTTIAIKTMNLYSIYQKPSVKPTKYNWKWNEIYSLIS